MSLSEKDRANIEAAIKTAMADAWADICSDTDCWPADIQRVGRGPVRLEFSPSTWTDLTASWATNAIAALLQAAREEAYKEGWNDREDDLIAGVNRIAPEEASQGAGEPVADEYGDRTQTCEVCKGNGEIVTDWERYLGAAQPGDTGDQGTADCPDCDGIGKIYAPTDPRTKALEEALRPFAAFADNVDQDGWTSNIHREGISVWFGPSDFRAAQAALSPVQAVKGDEHG